MKILVLFYSTYGHVYRMAEAAAEGARAVSGAEVVVKRVPETLPREVLEKMGALEAQKAFESVPVATVADLAEADAVIFGTPTRFGNMAAQMRSFLDATGGIWVQGALVGKVGGVFTSTGTQHGGQESTLLTFQVTLLHHGMLIAGLPYAFQGQTNNEGIVGGSPYGATTGRRDERRAVAGRAGPGRCPVPGKVCRSFGFEPGPKTLGDHGAAEGIGLIFPGLPAIAGGPGFLLTLCSIILICPVSAGAPLSPFGRICPMRDIEKIRNVAIIAHIDHGKTTLLDSVFRAARVFRENAKVEERVMDNNELERERGITIRAKHCSVEWKDTLINIIDTPGHADFSGEVERVLSMVDSVLLLVDANEGPMPQTRYVLMRALKAGLKPIVVVNKVDRPNASVQNALNATFDLFFELGATEEQADFPVLYGSGLHGWFVRDLEREEHTGMDALFETIVENVAPPTGDPEKPFLLQSTTLAWNDYIGRIGCGKVLQGRIKVGDPILRTGTAWKGHDRKDWEVSGRESARVTHLWVTHGLQLVEVEEVGAGDVVWIAGPEEIQIGDTLAAVETPDIALAPLTIEEPTVSMFFLVNTGPFSGKEGRAVTLRQIRRPPDEGGPGQRGPQGGRPGSPRRDQGFGARGTSPRHPDRGNEKGRHGIRVSPGPKSSPTGTSRGTFSNRSSS